MPKAKAKGKAAAKKKQQPKATAEELEDVPEAPAKPSPQNPDKEVSAKPSPLNPDEEVSAKPNPPKPGKKKVRAKASPPNPDEKVQGPPPDEETKALPEVGLKESWTKQAPLAFRCVAVLYLTTLYIYIYM